MERMFEWLHEHAGRWYFVIYSAFGLFSATAICAGAVALTALYYHPSGGEFLLVLGFSEACVLAALIIGQVRIARRAWPLLEWRCSERGSRGAVEAWRTAVGLPVFFVDAVGIQSVLLVALPVGIFTTVVADLPAYSAAIIFATALVAIAYSVVLQFFTSELALRPVIRQIAPHLPADFDAPHAGVPLRWKLLGALPLINIITGVVVSALSGGGNSLSLADLGLDVVVAVAVAFTLSLELTLLVTKSITAPVRDLLEATERVKRGQLDAKVPVLSGDEIGALTRSFNEMTAGIADRERLREAFGTYVDPSLAERVLTEGPSLEGDEVDATVMFVDIRGFTAFAEQTSARETVALLNDFFGLVVPVLTTHGGHANKFIGDGVLGVFGAPLPMEDHADRAVAAAREIARSVEAEYGERLRIGIGINSGTVVAGTVGGGGRLDYTVIGDTVNVASRVEDATARTGDTVLLTEATKRLLSDGRHQLVPRDEVELRGKSEPVPVYALSAGADRPTPGLAPAGAGSRRPAA